jgi:sugar/nucleoside kinase (ribokinase family)
MPPPDRPQARVLVIAPVCRDEIVRGTWDDGARLHEERDAARTVRSGGAALYASWALVSLGASVVLHTPLADTDRDLLSAFPRGVDLITHPSRETTRFEIRCDPIDTNRRFLTCRAAADPIDPARVDPRGCSHLLVAPLLPTDLDGPLMEWIRACGIPVDLGAQGICRRIGRDGAIEAGCAIKANRTIEAAGAARPHPTGAPFPPLRILAGDEAEIALLPETLRDAADEIVTTRGDRGAWIDLREEPVLPKRDRQATPPVRRLAIAAIPPAVPPRAAIGLGDTFLAVYGWARTMGMDPEAGGIAAARAATRLLENGLG